MSKKITLTRRSALAGIGTIGLAAAGAGLGTSAYLNDTEVFQNNSISAGTLNLKVGYRIEAADCFHDPNHDLPYPSDGYATLDGQSVHLDASDVKPGDWAILCFDVSVDGNPAYVKAFADITSNDENGYEEPEPRDNNGRGELADAIEVFIGSGYSDGELQGSMHVGSLADFVGYLDGWVLRGANGRAGSGDATQFGGDGGINDLPFCVMLKIPTGVGNEIQGDSLSFDFGFEAVQARHNDASNPQFQSNLDD